MKTIVQFGLAALAAGAFLVLPGKAETPDIFTKHGLPLPGAYFKNKESQKPATVAVSKSGQGVGEQKQTASKASFDQEGLLRMTAWLRKSLGFLIPCKDILASSTNERELTKGHSNQKNN